MKVTTAPYPALAADLRAKQLRDYAPELARMPFVGFVGPNDVPRVEVTPAGLWDRDELERSWTLALQYPRGGELNLRQTFGTVVDWMIIGPFPGAEGFAGHRAVFPPEENSTSARSTTALAVRCGGGRSTRRTAAPV